jgi:hypothetical protein
MSMYVYQDVVNSNPRPVVIREAIHTLLGLNSGQCYNEMEEMLMGNFSGSIQFDHCLAVEILLSHDMANGKNVHACMANNPQQNRRQVWGHLNTVLRQKGFDFKGGVLIGTRLENNPDSATEQSAEAA